MYHPDNPLSPAPKQRIVKVLAIAVLSITTAILVFGSRAKPETGADAAILLPPAKGLELALEKLFPAEPGCNWLSYVHDGPTITPVTTRGGGYHREGRGSTATLLSVVRDEVVQRAVFGLKDGVVTRVALGPKGETRIEPPMPLFDRSARFGEVLEWHGRFVAGSKAVPAVALYRISGLERIKTVAGEFDAHRIDSILLSQTEKNKLNRLQTTAWFAPGVGVVKEAYIQDGRAVQSELAQYHLSAASKGASL